MDANNNRGINNNTATWNSRKFGCVLAFFQISFIVLFAFIVEYDWDALPASKRNFANPPSTNQLLSFGHNSSSNLKASNGEQNPPLQEKFPLRDFYSMYGDIQVMIFCAFGLLIACFKRYGYSSINIAFVLCAFVVQWTTLTHGFFNLHDGKIKFSLVTLIHGDFAVAAVLISTCVVLGTISPLQYLVLAFLEVIFYSLNEWVCVKLLKVVDVGGAIYLHLFAAFFGLALSWSLHRPKSFVAELKKLKFGSKLNDLLAMVGTLMLFIYWPSFNSVFAPADLQNRAVINTGLSLLASCLGAFSASAVLSKDKFSMTIIQNGVLAGGVAIGSTADLMIQPYAALLIGFASGVLAVFGFLFISPVLENKLKLIDMCGVLYLHGLPGILAGLVGALVCGVATEEVYGSSYYEAFPAAVPSAESLEFSELQTRYPMIEAGYGRSAVQQAAFQLVAFVVSMSTATISGLFTGMILRLKVVDPCRWSEMMDDEQLWQMPKMPSREEEQDVKLMLEKLERLVMNRKESLHTLVIKEQLKGLESCLKIES